MVLKTDFVRGMENAQDPLNQNFEEIWKSIEDTGWIELPLSENFKQYSTATDTIPRIRRIGNHVVIIGLITPVATVSGTQNSVKIADIPDDFIPKEIVTTGPTRVCQGSGRAIWNVSVNYSGKTLNFSRYRETYENSYKDITTGAWLPFDIDYYI